MGGGWGVIAKDDHADRQTDRPELSLRVVHRHHFQFGKTVTVTKHARYRQNPEPQFTAGSYCERLNILKYISKYESLSSHASSYLVIHDKPRMNP